MISNALTKISCCSIWLFFLFSTPSAAQFVPISIEQRIANSTLILEGKVISQACYWDEMKTHIYTSNVVELYKVFKGQSASNKIEIITIGGVVDDRIERVTNMLQLTIGDTGIFTAIPNTVNLITPTGLVKYKTYAGIQGFIKYNLSTDGASDLFNTYKSLNDLYSKITTQTKKKATIIRKFQLRTPK